MLDGVASMWCNVWGHSNRELTGAISRQMRALQHAPLFNLTNEPAEELARMLVRMSPGMSRVFFSDNGSTAMEVALKIAIQYWRNTGFAKKTKIATLKNGYHGDTFGAMSVGYVPQFFKHFKSHLFGTVQFAVPNRYRLPRGYTFEDYTEHCLDKIEASLLGRDDIAAFVMESGAQMAGGVVVFPDLFQSRIRQLCKKHSVLFVLDEVATGMGRLGSMVQYMAQNSRPDIVAYGKMLTGGYLTMAATLATKKIYDSFLGEFDRWVHLLHGHTYTGNPVASAAAVKNLQMYEKYSLMSQVQKASGVFERYAEEISQMPLVGDVRYRGMLMGIELVLDKRKKTPFASAVSVNRMVYQKGRKNGIYLRTLGNIVMLVPPLAMPPAQLSMLIERTIQTIRDVNNVRS